MRAVIAGLLFLVATSAAARAQATSARPPRVHRVSGGLLGILFGGFSAEYERAARGELSLGLAAGWTSTALDILAGQDYSWGEVKARYYPNESAPEGFAFGAAVGVARVESIATGDCFLFCASTDRSATGPTAAITLDYSWLLGRSDRLYIGLGTGGKRIFGLRDSADDDFPTVLPSARVQFGVAF